MLTYSSGQAAEMLVAGVVGTFLLFYLTSVCGLRPGAAGLVLFISLSFDAVVDPLIGAATDGWKSRLGRRHPFMIAGLVLLPLSIACVFILPAGLPAAWIFGYVLAANILMRLSLSLFILPYAALLPEFTSDYMERSRLMIYRLVVALAAQAIVLGLSFGVFFKGEDALSEAAPYVPFALLVAGIIFLCCLIATFGTLPAALKLRPAPEERPPLAHFSKEIRELFGNPSFVSLFLGILIYMIAAVGFLNSINLHVFRYFWNLTPGQMQMPTVAQPFGMLLSIPLAAWLVRVVEKRTLMLIAIGAFVCAYGIPPVLKILGVLPAQGLAPLVCVILSGTVFGLCIGLSFVSAGSMVADATDEHDFLFGNRREGLYFATLVLASKAALGLGGLLAGFGLQLIGFPADPAGPEGAAQLTPQVVNRLGLLWGPVFAAGLLPAVPFFLRYRLDRKTHRQIVAAIAERNKVLNAPQGR